MISGLDLLFLEVNSLEESLAFYEKVLGMEVESVNFKSEPAMAKLRGGALRITLAQSLETILHSDRGVQLFIDVQSIDNFFEMRILRGADVQQPLIEGCVG